MDMRQPEQPLGPEAQGEEEEEEEDNDCYAACLTEDLQLFGQLNDLQDQDLLQLTNVVSANARNEREKENGLIHCRVCLQSSRTDLQEQACLV